MKRAGLGVALTLLGVLAGCATPQPPGPRVAGPDQRPAPFAPKRVSSTTMAVWLAAWEDDKGNLHAPATVYVVVDPTRWSYADPSTTSRYTVLRPLQVEQRPAEGGESRGAAVPQPPTPLPVPPGARRGAS
jgi:hypothetical protein